MKLDIGGFLDSLDEATRSRVVERAINGNRRRGERWGLERWAIAVFAFGLGFFAAFGFVITTERMTGAAAMFERCEADRAALERIAELVKEGAR